ncbi:unnamed protein product [Sphacelaria rigidula]
MSSNRHTKQTTCTTCHGDCASSKRCHRKEIPNKHNAQHVTEIVHQVKDVIEHEYQMHNHAQHVTGNCASSKRCHRTRIPNAQSCTTCHEDCASSERYHRTRIPYKQHAQHVTGIVHQVKDVIEQEYQTNNMHNMSRGIVHEVKDVIEQEYQTCHGELCIK